MPPQSGSEPGGRKRRTTPPTPPPAQKARTKQISGAPADDQPNDNFEDLLGQFDAAEGVAAEDGPPPTNAITDTVSRTISKDTTGLFNLGNTCYMASVVQCLRGTEELTRYFLAGLGLYDLNTENVVGAGGDWATAYDSLLYEIYSLNPDVLRPAQLKSAIGLHYPSFLGTAQQDAHEFLAAFLSYLEEDLCRINQSDRNMVMLPDSTDEMANDRSLLVRQADTIWQLMLTRDDSIIRDLFGGLFRSSMTCRVCHTVRTKFEYFNNVSLEIPGNGSEDVHLTSCFDVNGRDELLSGEERWNCPRCEIRQDTDKAIHMWKTPDILIIHLKRFQNVFEVVTKKTNTVIFPIEGLDLKAWVECPGATELYDLFGIVNHWGDGLRSGHYTADVKSFVDHQWHNYNDTRVTNLPVAPSGISKDAYILFYRRRSESPLGGGSGTRIRRLMGPSSGEVVLYTSKADADAGIGDLNFEVSDETLAALDSMEAGNTIAQNSTRLISILPAATEPGVLSWKNSRTTSLPTFSSKQTSVHKQRRMRTVPETHEINISPETIAQETYKRIIRNLRQQHFETSWYNYERFGPFLPQAGFTQRQLQIFDIFQDQPLVVPTVLLKEILALELSTVESPPLEGDHFYVRSWELAGHQLEAVIRYMADNDNGYFETIRWHDANIIWNSQSTPCTFTIRYVGMCQGPKRPIDRYIEDLTSRKSGGILVEFCNALDQLFPEVAANGECHLITHASIPSFVNRIPQEIDEMERFLITLFGQDTLLNRQRGGFFVNYVPLARDVGLFGGLKTRFHQRFYEEARMLTTNPQMYSALRDHFDEVQLFANNNPAHTGTVKHPFTDGVKKEAFTNATPMLYKGHVVLCLIGKDITLGDYLTETSFFSGSSRSGEFVRSFLCRLAGQEYDNHGNYWDERVFDTSFVPFFNLWTWLWHRDLEDAINFLRRCLAVIRPLIAVSFSQRVTALVRENLRYGSRRGRRSFVKLAPIVGEPTIQYYTDYSVSEKDNENDAFIAIPCMDPGRDKYNGSVLDLRFRRLMDLTLQRVFLLANIATQTLDELTLNSLIGIWTKKQICDEILRRWHVRRSNDTDVQNFDNNFEVVRREYASSAVKLYNYVESDHTRPILNRQGLEQIAAIGLAIGDPYSAERRAQLEDLWSQDVDDLHITIAHEPDNKEQWINLFFGLPQNQYLFLRVVADIEDEDDYLNTMFQIFRPEWGDDESWVSNPQDKRQTIVHCGLWIRKQLESEKHKPAQKLKPITVPTAYLQSLPIALNANGDFGVPWRRDDNSIVTVRLTMKDAIPSRSHDIRILDFTKHGIDVCDGTGKPFRSRVYSDREATFPYPYLVRYRNNDLREMWEAARKYLGHAVPEIVIEEGVIWEGGKGVGVITSKQGEHPVQNRPLKNTDANWLLREFVDIRFPLGGTFFINSKEDWPKSTGEIAAFIEFLKQPQYINHPYTEYWVSLFHESGAKNHASSRLVRNLRFLRQVTYSRVKTSVPGEKRSTNVAKIVLGPSQNMMTNPEESADNAGGDPLQNPTNDPEEGDENAEGDELADVPAIPSNSRAGVKPRKKTTAKGTKQTTVKSTKKTTAKVTKKAIDLATVSPLQNPTNDPDESDEKAGGDDLAGIPGIPSNSRAGVKPRKKTTAKGTKQTTVKSTKKTTAKVTKKAIDLATVSPLQNPTNDPDESDEKAGGDDLAGIPGIPSNSRGEGISRKTAVKVTKKGINLATSVVSPLQDPMNDADESDENAGDDETAGILATPMAGIPAIPCNSRADGEEPRQNRPPNQADANWLLYSFLEERFPEAGDFHTCPTSESSRSTGDLQAFVKFIRRTEHIGHPYATFWLKQLDRTKPNTGVLTRNIMAYRSFWRRVLHFTAQGKRKRYPVFCIGAPGTGASEVTKDLVKSCDAGTKAGAWTG